MQCIQHTSKIHNYFMQKQPNTHGSKKIRFNHQNFNLSYLTQNSTNLHDSKLKMISKLRSTTSWQGNSKMRDTICNILKRSSWNWLGSRLEMIKSFSMMLVQRIGGEIGAQLCTNPPKFGITMDASIFKYASVWHCMLQFHVQNCSTTPQDQESSNGMCSCLKICKKILREKN